MNKGKWIGIGLMICSWVIPMVCAIAIGSAELVVLLVVMGCAFVFFVGLIMATEW